MLARYVLLLSRLHCSDEFVLSAFFLVAMSRYRRGVLAVVLRLFLLVWSLCSASIGIHVQRMSI